MTLKATKPVLESSRFKALIHGPAGAGKTHLCCSFPSAYYIDSENNINKYPQFVSLLNKNNSVCVYLNELGQIIDEVKELMSTKHVYKTLIIDSLSMPCGWLAEMEVDRLVDKAKKSRSEIEGTEFGANLAKPKRLTYRLAMLLNRIDMNVVVVCQQKPLFEYCNSSKERKEVGKTYDISDKMAYALGSVIQIVPTAGFSKKAIISKSRYSGLENNTTIAFDDGFEVLRERLGDEMFLRDSIAETFATKDQISMLNNLMTVLNVSAEIEQKWLASCKCSDFTEMGSENIQKFIDACNKKLSTKTGE